MCHKVNEISILYHDIATIKSRSFNIIKNFDSLIQVFAFKFLTKSQIRFRLCGFISESEMICHRLEFRKLALVVSCREHIEMVPVF